MHLRFILTAGFVICASVSAFGQMASPFEFQAPPGGVRVIENGRPVLFYQRTALTNNGTHSRSNYVHPLYDLDGNVLTEDFPADHLHHRGLFWTWHQTLVGDKQIGDPWLCTDFVWDVIDVKQRFGKSQEAILESKVIWKSPQFVDNKGSQQPIVQETNRVRVFPIGRDHQIIDFEIQLLAIAEKVRIGGSNDVKGYGGFSARVRMPQDIVFTGPDGRVEPTKKQIKAGPWMNVTATYGKGLEKSGVTILGHPTNPNHPQPWILRKKGSMQNVVYPGREAVELSQDTPLVLRYRVVVHRGVVDGERIGEWYAEYGKAE